jgi:hypothetical protein
MILRTVAVVIAVIVSLHPSIIAEHPAYMQDQQLDLGTPEENVAPAEGSPGLQALLDGVNEERLMGHIQALQGVRTRHVNSGYDDPTKGIGAAYNYILSQFQAISAESDGNLAVWTQYFPLNWYGVQSEARNVVAVVGDTNYEGGTIIIGAHYDSRCLYDDDASGYAPGANDNASGVAALIELGRILSSRPHHARIFLVAFSAEEVGRKGSQAFLNDYVLPNHVAVKAMINLDIIGSSTAPNGAINDHQIRLFSPGAQDSVSRQLARMIQLTAARYMPSMEILVQNSDNGDRPGRYGDHLTFSDAGIPAVRFIEAVEDTNRQHSERDLMDDVQPDYLAQATRTVLVAVTVLADGPQSPLNIALHADGTTVCTAAWDRVPGAVSYLVAVRSTESLTFEHVDSTDATSWQFDCSRRLAVAALDSSGLMGGMAAELAA